MKHKIDNILQNIIKISMDISVEDLELLRDMRNCPSEPTTLEDTLIDNILQTIIDKAKAQNK